MSGYTLCQTVLDAGDGVMNQIDKGLGSHGASILMGEKDCKQNGHTYSIEHGKCCGGNSPGKRPGELEKWAGPGSTVVSGGLSVAMTLE